MTRGGRRAAAGLVLVALVSFLPGLLSPRDFAAGDEARYAEVLREMCAGGSWLVPHLDGHAYSDKPPVYFWLAAAAARACGGIAPSAFLLITWLGAAASVLVTYRLALALYGERAGRLAALVLTSTLLFLACAQIVRMDMLMSLFISLAMLAFLEGIRTPARRLPFHLFYLFAAAAVLFKGPLGVLIPFLAAAGFLAGRRRWRELRRLVLHPGWLLFVILVGGWLAAAWLAGEQAFLRDIWVRQVVGRTVSSSVQRQPFYFYLLLLPLLLLPWSAFLYAAVRRGWREGDDGTRLLLWWLAGGTAAISAISGKLFIYLLPMVPPAAILIGRHLAEAAPAPRLMRWAGGAGAVLMFGGAAAIPFIAARFAPLPGFASWIPAASFLCLAALAAAFAWRARLTAYLATVCAGMFGLSLLVLQVLPPLAGGAMSDRALAEELARLSHEGRPTATYHLQRGMCSFYAGLVLPSLDAGDLAGHLGRPEAVLALPRREFDKRRAALGAGVEVLASYDIVGKTYLVVGRR